MTPSSGNVKSPAKAGYILGSDELDAIFSAGNLKQLRRMPLATVEYHCLKCMGGSLRPWRTADGTIDGPHLPYSEVRDYPTTHRELWPFRKGRNPYTTRKGNPDALRKARQVQLQAGSNGQEPHGTADEGGGGSWPFRPDPKLHVSSS